MIQDLILNLQRSRNEYDTTRTEGLVDLTPDLTATTERAVLRELARDLASFRVPRAVVPVSVDDMYPRCMMGSGDTRYDDESGLIYAPVPLGELAPGMSIADDTIGLYGMVEEVTVPSFGRTCVKVVRGADDFEYDEADDNYTVDVVATLGASCPVSSSPIFSDLV